jgi:GTPase SAR1 family protein
MYIPINCLCVAYLVPGGQESLRASWSTYYVGTHAVMMVVDSTDRDRIGLVKEELWKMLAEKELEKSIVLIYANKQDMDNKMTPAEMATALNLVALKDINVTWHIQPCCALAGEGLLDVRLEKLHDSHTHTHAWWFRLDASSQSAILRQESERASYIDR